MNKALHALSAALALASLAGCGNPQPTGETPADPPTGLTAPADVPAPGQDDAPAAMATPHKPAVAPSAAPQAEKPAVAASAAAFDPMNARFSLDGQTVTLRNGVARVPAAPGSASSITTHYLGKPARGDLTGDGREDLAYFVTREGAGSGRFTYVVAAIAGPGGYRTTNAFLVGDRIEPQSLRINAGELQVNFAGRARDEPMTAPPSRDTVLLLKVTQDGVLEGLMR